MTSKVLIAALLMSSLPLSACDQAANRADGGAAATNTDAAATAVKDTEAAMLAAFQAKDPAKLTAFYAPDGFFATPGRIARGSEALGKAMAEDVGDPAFTLTFANETTDVSASGDLAYTTGNYNVTFTNPETRQVEKAAGPYVTVFRKQSDGSWKVVADIATPGAPGQGGH